jgi:hypothetical protein
MRSLLDLMFTRTRVRRCAMDNVTARKLVPTTFCLLLILTGCETLNRWTAVHPGDEHVSFQGADRISTELDNISLIKLIDPSTSGTSGQGPDSIEVAFQGFYKNEKDQVRRRNSIQETIVATSDQRCAVYLNYLQAQAANGNFIFGTLATVAGGAGAIFTHVAVSRALSGVAGIFSGVRAEYNQDYFSNLAVNVISHGIQVRRTTIHEQMQRDGQTKSITDYTVEAAVKDAMFYHGQCGIIAGLDQASASIKTTEDPGLDQMTKALVKVNIMRKTLDNRAVDIATVLDGKSLNSAGAVLAGTPNGKIIGQLTLPIQELVTVTADWPQQFDDYAVKLKADRAVPPDASILKKFADAKNASLNLTDICTAPAMVASKNVQNAAAVLAAGSTTSAQHDFDAAKSAGDAVTAQIDKLRDLVVAAMAKIRAVLDAEQTKPIEPDALKAANDSLTAIILLAQSKSYCQVSIGP